VGTAKNRKRKGVAYALDPPPLKWSDLKYNFWKEAHDEEVQT